MSESVQLDPVDWQILSILQDDASITNKALADRVGLPTSSCHERVRRLRTAGVIDGIRASVNPAAVGRGLQAFIAVRLRPHRRDMIESFTAAVLELPETLALYNVSGPEDFFLHVAVVDSTDLQRLIIDDLASRPEIAHCQTHLIFDRPLVTSMRPYPDTHTGPTTGWRNRGSTP
ncbi:Lrp/AsnC family transcriptional regulator [Phytoactinopolyspora halotolerans]|uniref:Lrp/AsnC family transcriptional regulator n=1 Tax=Phytoactinopolyspora halotolerans TaxID=1981512 RepID=A0A6L9SIB7_9ACTN|nr:Lrp/AsnC family transcriptional regulator [Phytoactinopolyspora halotolerans]NEE04428.1 Lrp/AsnC family transcriptional regulator [Phytoactinopolyspora halotolerans]